MGFEEDLVIVDVDEAMKIIEPVENGIEDIGKHWYLA